MHEYFRGNPNGKSPLEFLREREPIPAEYRDRDARLRVMDKQGLEAIWLFPTLGVLYEELLKHDTEAVALTFRAFNQWLDEDWGFCLPRAHLRGALHPDVPTRDGGPRARVVARARRARGVHAARAGLDRGRPALARPTPLFDPFWARVNEAGITVVVHAGDSGYSANGYARDGFGASFERRLEALDQVVQHRARRARLPDHAGLREALRPLPEPAHRLGRERLRLPRRICSRSCAKPRRRLRVGSRRIRSRRSGATSGSTRSGRTT